MGDGVSTLLTSGWDDFEKWFGLGGKTTATITPGMNPAQTKLATTSATMKNAGVLLSLFGAANSAIGGYFAAKTQQYQLKSQASSMQFQSNMAAINAGQEELSAQSAEESGKTQVEQYTMRAGQEAASAQVATAARGVDLSSASAVDQRASQELVKQLDVNTIVGNYTRAAWADRTQATNYRNQSLLDNVSASNLKVSADTVSPGFAATTSLLNSASGIASQWDWRRRLQLAGVGGN